VGLVSSLAPVILVDNGFTLKAGIFAELAFGSEFLERSLELEFTLESAVQLSTFDRGDGWTGAYWCFLPTIRRWVNIGGVRGVPSSLIPLLCREGDLLGLLGDFDEVGFDELGGS